MRLRRKKEMNKWFDQNTEKTYNKTLEQRDKGQFRPSDLFEYRYLQNLKEGMQSKFGLNFEETEKAWSDWSDERNRERPRVRWGVIITIIVIVGAAIASYVLWWR